MKLSNLDDFQFINNVRGSFLNNIAITGVQTGLVAFSGGPDSMVLAHLITHSHYRRGFNFIHINHGMDPESTTRSSVAIHNLSKFVGVEKKRILLVGPPAKPPKNESEARKYRYGKIRTYMEELGLFPNNSPKRRGVIVTAHHSDDYLETVLHRMIRGTGVDGLSPMEKIAPLPNHAPMHIYRPLLDLKKEHIYRYLELNQLPYVNDTTNLINDNPRNVIRNEIIPKMDKLHKRAPDNIYRLITQINEDNTYLNAQAVSALMNMSKNVDNNTVKLGHHDLHRLSLPIRRRVVAKAVQMLRPSAGSNFQEITEIMELQHGKKIDRRGLFVEYDKNYLVITRK